MRLHELVQTALRCPVGSWWGQCRNIHTFTSQFFFDGQHQFIIEHRIHHRQVVHRVMDLCTSAFLLPHRVPPPRPHPPVMHQNSGQDPPGEVFHMFRSRDYSTWSVFAKKEAMLRWAGSLSAAGQGRGTAPTITPRWRKFSRMTGHKSSAHTFCINSLSFTV